MASSCKKCLQQKRTSAPSIFCHDCEELLCQPCAIKHQHSKDTKEHSATPYEDYQKLPPFILKTNLKCLQHGQRYKYFCRIHDESICEKCYKKNHKKCEDVPKIEDIVYNVKTSVVFEDTISEMESMCQKLSSIADDRDQNIKQLKREHKEMHKEIEQKFDNMINILQKLKTDKIAELDSVYTKLTNDISNTSQTVQSEERKLRSILVQRDEILRYTSNYLTFIGVKEMEIIVKNIDINLNELSKDEKLMKCNLKFQVNETIGDIIHDIQSLGDIQVTKSPPTVSTQNTEARYLEAVKVVQGPVHLHLQQTIELDRLHNYWGCCTLPGGLVVIADNGDIASNDCKILIHKSDGSLRSTINFDESERVYDVTPVDEHHVAVSHHRSGTISIIDVDSDQVVKKLKVGGVVTGLCCSGRDIVCCVEDKGLMRVNIDRGKIETVVEDENVNYYSHVDVSNSLICYTGPYTHTVNVLDTQYNVIFTYKDKAVLSFPTGVTIDDHSNIYVTGFWSHNLIMISSDGKSCHQLLGKDDGLGDPTAVHYDSSTKKLVVVNGEGGPAFVFSVE